MALTQKGQTGLVKQAAEPLVLLHASSPPWHVVTQPLINLYQHKDIQATKTGHIVATHYRKIIFFSLFPTELFWHIYLVEGCFDFDPCWPLNQVNVDWLFAPVTVPSADHHYSKTLSPKFLCVFYGDIYVLRWIGFVLVYTESDHKLWSLKIGPWSKWN